MTATVQLAPAATLLPDVQLLLPTAKSVPAIDVVPSTSAAFPVFVRVTVCAVAVAPTVVEAKVNCTGDALAAGAPTAAPVPDSETVLVDGVALCAIVNVAFAAPVAVGAKRTDTEQLPPAATLLPEVQVLLPMEKLPEMVVAPKVNAAVPLFVSVIVCAAEVDPTLTLPKLSDVAERLAIGLPLADAGLAMYAARSCSCASDKAPRRNAMSPTPPTAMADLMTVQLDPF